MIKVNNDKVIQRKYSGREFTKAAIEKYIKSFQEKYKNKNLTNQMSWHSLTFATFE